MNKTPAPDILKSYIHAFETLTVKNLDDSLRPLFSKDAIFIDPFNEIHGIETIVELFKHMFETCHFAKFNVKHCAHHDGIAYLHWTMDVQRTSKSQALTIEGLSQIFFEEDHVYKHIDYWDTAQIFQYIPLLSWVIRKISTKLALPKERHR
jgi:steroid delta-isomerase